MTLHRRNHAPLLVVLSSLSLTPAAADGQVRITSILAPDSTARESTDDVAFVPWGSFEDTTVHVGQRVSIGDELRSKSGGTVVEMSCGGGPVVTLARDFRVAIGSDSTPCVVDLRAGEAHIMGDSTAAEVGGVTMGAARTLYVVSAGRDSLGPLRRLTVFEGVVDVTGGRLDSVRVEAHQVLEIQRGARERPVTERDIADAASLYARLDLARAAPEVKATPSDLGAAYRGLYEAHKRVLESPREAGARVDLVEQQVQLRATSQSTLYHIEKVRAEPVRSGEARATTEALASAAYLQLDRPQEAAAADRRFEAADPVTRNAARRRLAEAATVLPERAERYPVATGGSTMDTLRVSVRPDPTATAAGRPVRVLVTVLSAAGAPVPGAEVKLTADGGFFRGSLEATALGGTDAGGAYTAIWECERCAAAHAFQVSARKRGFIGGQARTRVGIR